MASRGYFSVLFSIIRVESLNGIGRTDAAAVTEPGQHLLSMQIGGLLGGILWGVPGDERGRLSVLFGSILLYSLADSVNGFVQTIAQYAWLRLLAGVGLAGEPGAMTAASVGVSGAMVAYWIGAAFGWRCG